MKYQITSYQLIFRNGDRDTVKPIQPILTVSIERERDRLRERHGAQHVNLNYTELPEDEYNDE